LYCIVNDRFMEPKSVVGEDPKHQYDDGRCHLTYSCPFTTQHDMINLRMTSFLFSLSLFIHGNGL
jgi:hypothetical protein